MANAAAYVFLDSVFGVRHYRQRGLVERVAADAVAFLAPDEV